ncbi:hypothetical protein Sango_0655300 [Sesamum angolense]|uniref:DUF4218 domain-containing protein n=1 Tax=Sesamum angolense TaxID=2727404 RepID=A0AAE2C2F5_9LAMI|nr:hypothetical protein Sango_0655300 [Sesamum angolense]
MLPEHVWNTLIEVSRLFQSICSTTLDVHKLHEMENSVSIILCNLENIFLPTLFDSMKYLIVHLPYEARVGRPLQYRWMYPFERFLRELKKKYFKLDVQSKRSMPRRNDKRMSNDNEIPVSIFNYPSRASGATKKRWLSGPERHISETYVLANYEVVTPYYDIDSVGLLDPRSRSGDPIKINTPPLRGCGLSYNHHVHVTAMVPQVRGLISYYQSRESQSYRPSLKRLPYDDFRKSGQSVDYFAK